ncbi:Leucine-rich repeat protein soc-2 -like protein [Halotydeus destructor]|nr:Leucine-rich repeat protein soc-2 -like protein [Halotydeus destructor]
MVDFSDSEESIKLADDEVPFDEFNYLFQVSEHGRCDLSNKTILTFPLTLFTTCPLSSLSHLHLDYNYMIELPDEVFQLTNLKQLTVTGNKLSSLNPLIVHLVRLEVFHADENQLRELPDSFCGLTHLRELRIQSNKLKRLPDKVGDLRQLKSIKMDENLLEELPDSFGNLSQLEKCDAAYNKFKRLPETFGSLDSLRFLDLSYNRHLESLPSSFEQLPSLEIFDISCNALAVLPDQLCSAPKLTRLSLDNNLLTAVPDWFGQLENVEELTLRSNYVRGNQLHPDFGHVCKKLKKFDISGNLFDKLPDSFSHLQSIEDIDMGSPLFEPERKKNLPNGNHIVKFPPNFGAFYFSLKELRIDECQVDELPEDFGDGLSNLTYFDAHCNYLQKLPDSFCKLRNLEFCILSMNDLLRLPDEVGQLKSLKELRLESNHLVNLPPSFEDLTSLQTLDLFANEFESFPNVLHTLPNLKILEVGIDVEVTNIVLPEHLKVTTRTAIDAAQSMRQQYGILYSWSSPPSRSTSPDSAYHTISHFERDEELWDDVETLTVDPRDPYAHEDPLMISRNDPTFTAKRGWTIVPHDRVLPCDKLPQKVTRKKFAPFANCANRGEYDDDELVIESHRHIVFSSLSHDVPCPTCCEKHHTADPNRYKPKDTIKRKYKFAFKKKDTRLKKRKRDYR